ncbi:hypothetical protein THAOC_37383, partial [Thalassiosira oceanica]
WGGYGKGGKSGGYDDDGAWGYGGKISRVDISIVELSHDRTHISGPCYCGGGSGKSGKTKGRMLSETEVESVSEESQESRQLGWGGPGPCRCSYVYVGGWTSGWADDGYSYGKSGKTKGY